MARGAARRRGAPPHRVGQGAEVRAAPPAEGDGRERAPHPGPGALGLARGDARRRSRCCCRRTRWHPRLRTEGRPKATNALGTLAQYPELARAYHTFNGHIIYNTSLSPRQRELLVLRVAAVRGSEYEWVQHVVLAADVGITGDEVARVDGPDADGWTPVDAATPCGRSTSSSPTPW